jgi:probable F420-dependent oxidoreductase
MTVPELGRIGLWTSSLDTLPMAQAQRAVATIESQGWGGLWFGEAYGREAMTAAQLYLAATDRLVVATGIASIYARDAVATAGAARTLSALSGNRFLLGLGVSHAPLVERMRGHSYGKPVQAMREYLAAMDTAPYAVAGEEPPAPRVVAALGPKMLEVARDHAQGAHPYLVTPQHTAQARERLGPGPVLAVEQAVVLDEDLEEWERRAQWHLEIYTGLPNYRNSWLRQGFTEDDFVRGGSLALKQGMVMRGMDQIQARVQEHLDAGASHVCLQVLGPDTFTAPVDDWRELAGALLS